MADNRRPVSGSRSTVRRPVRRKKKKNTYLCLGIALACVACALLIGIIISMTSNGDNVSEAQPDGSDSTPGFGETSVTESSKPDETSEAQSVPQSESSEASQEPLSSTEKYEQSVGVKYAIDMTDYEKYVCPADESKYVFIVNPEHTLSADYVPEGLVKCSSMRAGRPDYYSKMVDVANYALTALLKEAAYYGYDNITVTNAYRSYATQKWLFEYYCDSEWKSGKYATYEDAVTEVLTYSTRPGTSEHQSGLCCDMHNVDVSSPRSFNNTKAAKWLEDNAYRFGFILRYPDGKQDVTGIIYESWHFRYVGRTAATEMHNAGLTLDEYLAG